MLFELFFIHMDARHLIFVANKCSSPDLCLRRPLSSSIVGFNHIRPTPMDFLSVELSFLLVRQWVLPPQPNHVGLSGRLSLKPTRLEDTPIPSFVKSVSHPLYPHLDRVTWFEIFCVGSNVHWVGILVWLLSLGLNHRMWWLKWH